jgi:hypothetical protein
VPWLRRVLSVGANRFLSLFARERYRSLVPRGRLSTLTGMVRAYDGRFLRGLSPRSISMEINPEIVYKAMLLRARIEEVPARLDWRLQNAKRGQRKSSMRILGHSLSVLLSGFVFRPFMFFILPGLALLSFAAYCNAGCSSTSSGSTPGSRSTPGSWTALPTRWRPPSSSSPTPSPWGCCP